MNTPSKCSAPQHQEDISMRWRPPGEVFFGADAFSTANSSLAQVGSRALICADPVMRSTGALTTAERALTEAGIATEVFVGGSAEFDSSTVEECVRGIPTDSVDMVVGLGGGSNIDLAKVVSLALSHGGPLTHFYGEGEVPGPVLPVVAVPTTAGTGSEVTPVAVLSDPSRELKVGISSPWLTPRIAIVDPHLSRSCPPAVSAHAGMDAVAHAVEAFTARAHRKDELADTQRVFVGKNPISDQLALEAVRLLLQHIVTVIEVPNDMSARSGMALGSLLAGMAFGVAGTTAAHALQYPIGARTQTSHGLGVAMLLPHVLEMNLSVRTAEIAAIERMLDRGSASDDRIAASSFIATLRETNERVGIPGRLREIGVSRRDIPQLAQAACSVTRLLSNNARVLDKNDVRDLYLSAL